MIIEQRTYPALPGKWRDYLALYQAEGLAIQHRILGRMVGYYTTETGPLNQIVHLWAYEDLNERAELERLRRENQDLRMDNEFLGKAAAFFASKQNPRSGSR